ncbi:MAG: class I SAM-dependent methyltransferase [Chloroflexi bacterium]|nr:class I SAM-dependent methyltransferase [Chloroflexota bacterium]
MAADSTLDITRQLITMLFGRHLQHVGVRLWDGSQLPDASPRRTTVVLNHPGALRAMLLPGDEVSLGEAYLYNDIDIEGDVEGVFALAQELQQELSGSWRKLMLAKRLLRLPAIHTPRDTRRGRARLAGRRHSVRRDRQAIAYHYNVSNEFYALWQDSRMVYSCAYFRTPDDDLETAQLQKLDYICRKLRLRPGQTLLDVGCGWGGLVIHAAQHYGVKALGITLSEPQAEEANRRIERAGLADRAEVLVADYREVEAPKRNGTEGYDALVSVGMFEHVGEALLPAYFERAWGLLRPGGLFLNHGIARRATDPPQRGRSFSNTYVFPDGELVPIGTTIRVAEDIGFEVRDVESLREHYALTLRHWVRNLEAHHEEALRFVDEPTYRVWRLFMSGSAYGFTVGQLNVYQTLLLKPYADGSSGLPLTREDWYQTSEVDLTMASRARLE